VRGWKEQLTVAATLFVLLPLVNLMTTASHLFVTLPVGNWRLASVDLVCLMAGVLLFGIARRIGRTAAVVPHAIPAPMAEAGQG